MNWIYAALKKMKQKKSISLTLLFISKCINEIIFCFKKKGVVSEHSKSKKKDFQHPMLLTPIVWELTRKTT